MLTSIAFIPDGNRRYAQKTGLSLVEAYKVGFDRARQAFDWSIELEPTVKEATIWTISTENLERNKVELSLFLSLLRSKLKESLTDPSLDEKGVRINIFGRISALPKGLQSLITELHEETAHNTRYLLNLAIGYGGRAEMVDAVNALVAQELPITEQNLSKCMYTQTEPDLIVRTGGTQRLSGFMPWQSAYSELYFSDKLWPEFEKRDLAVAIDDYKSRQRRFGR